MASTKIPSILYNVSQTPLTAAEQKLARDNSYTLGSLTRDMNSTAGSWNSLTDTGFYQVQMSPTSESDPDSPESGRVTALVSTQGTDADRTRYTLQLAMGDSLKYRFFSYRTPAPDPGTWTAWKEVGSEQSATSEKLEKTLTLTTDNVEHEYRLRAEINSSGYGVFRLADILTASNTWNDHTEIRYGELKLTHNNSDSEIKQSANLADRIHGMQTPGAAIRVTDVLGPSSRNVTLLSSSNLRLYTGTTNSPEYSAKLNVQELSFSYSTLSQSASYGKTGLTVTAGTAIFSAGTAGIGMRNTASGVTSSLVATNSGIALSRSSSGGTLTLSQAPDFVTLEKVTSGTSTCDMAHLAPNTFQMISHYTVGQSSNFDNYITIKQVDPTAALNPDYSLQVEMRNKTGSATYSGHLRPSELQLNKAGTGGNWAMNLDAVRLLFNDGSMTTTYGINGASRWNGYELSVGSVSSTPNTISLV